MPDSDLVTQMIDSALNKSAPPSSNGTPAPASTNTDQSSGDFVTQLLGKGAAGPIAAPTPAPADPDAGFSSGYDYGVDAAPPSFGRGVARGIGEVALGLLGLQGDLGKAAGVKPEDNPVSMGDGMYAPYPAPTSQQANDITEENTGVDLMRPSQTLSEGFGQLVGNVAANAPLMFMGGPEAAAAKEAPGLAVRLGKYTLGALRSGAEGGGLAFAETPGDVGERADAAKIGGAVGLGAGLVLPPVFGLPAAIADRRATVDVGGQKFSPAGVRNAGQKLGDAVGPDGQAVLDQAATAPTTPGYQPTLAELLPNNPKVADIEQQARTSDQAGFTERADQQAKSEIGAINSVGGEGDAQTVAPRLQAGLDATTADGEAAIANERQTARQALNQAPAPAFTDQPATNPADEHFTAPEQYGADARASILSSRQSAEAQRDAVKAEINQDGNVVVQNGNDDPIRSNLRSVYTADIMPDVTGPEAQLLARVQALPDNAPLNQLTLLRRQVSDAIDGETPIGGARMTPAGRRLVTIKNSIDEAIDNSAAQAAAGGPATPPAPPPAPAASSTAASVSPPAPVDVNSSVPSTPLKGPNRMPESLVDFLISKGGIQDQGGDLKAMGADSYHHRAGGRLVNPKGMALDYAREAAIGEGFLPPNATIADLLDAIREHTSGRPTYRQHEQFEATQRRQDAREAALNDDAYYDARDRVNMAEESLGIRMNPDERIDATEQHLYHGVDPVEAVQQAVLRTQNRVLNDNAARNAFGSPGMPLAEQQMLDVRGGGIQNPRYMTAEEAAAHQQVQRMNRDIAETYNAGTVGDLLGYGEHPSNVRNLSDISRANGGFKLQDAEVMPKIWNGQGTEGANVRQFLRAGGNVERLKAWAADDLRRTALDGEGNLDPKAYEAWKAKHAAGLNSLPELRQVFDTAAEAQRAVQNVAERHAQAVADYRTAAVRKFLNQNPQAAVREIFENGDSAKNAADILGKIGTDADGQAGLRRAVGDYIGDQYSPLSKTGSTIRDDVKAMAFNQFLIHHQAALTQLYGKDGVDVLRQVGSQMQQRAQMPSQLRVRVPPEQHGLSGGNFVDAELLAELARHGAEVVPGGKLALGGGLGAVRLVQRLRAAGVRSEGQLLSMAALNPTTVGRQLLAITERPQGASPMMVRRLAAAIGATAGSQR